MNQILQTTPLPATDQPTDLLGEAVPVLDMLADADAWLEVHGGDVKCLITHSLRGAPSALVERLPNLRLIANFGAGLDLIDLDKARERGVAVTASGDVLAEDVADLALWLILSLLRGNVAADAFVRAGTWRERPYPLGRSARGRRLGLLGFGRIGQAIARRAEALGMEIAYHSRSPLPGSSHRHHASAQSLSTWADMLAVVLPGGEATRRMVDAELLAALGPEGMLISVARGSVVDDDALIAALENGTLGAAAIDAFEREPAIDARLLAAPRLLLSPHIGSATSDCRRAMLEQVVANVRRWRAGEPPLGLVY